MQSGTRGLAWGRILIVVLATMAAGQAAQSLAAETSPVTPELRDRSVAAMRDVFEKQDRWVKIHAGRISLGTGLPGRRSGGLSEGTRCPRQRARISDRHLASSGPCRQ